MKGAGVSDLVWRRRSGAVMEIPAGLPAKKKKKQGGRFEEASTSSAAFILNPFFYTPICPLALRRRLLWSTQLWTSN